MKILYITNHLQGTDGWSRYSLTLIKEVRQRGHDVRVIVQEGSEIENGIFQLPFLKEHYHYLLNFFECFFSGRKVISHINEWKPDIVHFIVEPYANMLPFLSMPKSVKVFLTMHGTFSFPPNLFGNFFKKTVSKFFLSLSLRKVKRIVTVSNFTRDYFLKNIKEIKHPNISVITNGVEIPILKHYEKSKIPQILFVGAVKERKGLRETVEILKYYSDFYSNDFVYVVVGKYNPMEKYFIELKKMIADYSLEKNVKFIGQINEEELEKYYEESHLFLLLPKRDGNCFEGFGLVYLEANARGIAVIGGGNSGAPEAINDGKSGFVADFSKKKDVALLMNKILKDKIIKSEDCINWAKENRIEKKTDEILSLYQNE